MGRQITIALAIFSFFLGSDVHAFRLFHHLGVKDGLPSYQTYAVAQDQHGLIWIGTENGLARYDGYKITVFQHDSTNSNSLSSNTIRCLFIGSHGRLWIGTDNGLDLFDAQHNDFLHITNKTNELGPSRDSISALAGTTSGNILVGTNGHGLLLLDSSGKTISTYRHETNDPFSISNNAVRTIYVDNRGRIWVGTRNGLNRLDKNTGHFQHYYHNSSKHSLSNSNIVAIAGDGNQGLWIGTFSGLNHTQDDAHTFIRYTHKTNDDHSLPNNFIHALLLDKNDNLWVSSYLGGISKYDPGTSSFVTFKHSLSDPYSIGDSDVWGMIIDSSDTLWAATDSGLSFTNLHNLRVTYLQPTDTPSDTSIDSAPNMLAAYDHYLLIAVDRGLDIYDINTGKIQHEGLSANSPTLADSGTTDTITAITPIDKRQIWLGTLNGQLLSTSIDSNIRTTYKRYGSETIQGSILNILYFDNNSLLLTTTSGQLLAFDLKTHIFTDIDVNHFLNGQYISILQSISNGGLIIGTNSGLYTFSLSYTNNSTSTIHLLNKHLIYPVSALSIYKESPTSYWIGTTQGIKHLCFDIKYYKTTPCTMQKNAAPPLTRIKGIEPGIDNDLWLSTSIGLYDYNPITGRTQYFGTPQGLPFDNLFERMYAKTNDNRIWFGGSEGIIGFNPSDVHIDTIPPELMITNIYARGPYSKKRMRINNNNDLIVRYSDRNLVIDYTALDYASPDANVFSYRLFGFDSNWIDAANVHEAVYTNISPGHYKFEVRGSNNWGVWNKQPAVVNITVLPPWWRTWWAYLAYTLLVLGGMFAYVHTQQLKLRKEREVSAKLRDADAIKSNFVSELETRVSNATEELRSTLETVNLKNQELEIAHKRASEGEQLKSQFLANMSHELRTPLNAILGYLKLLLQTSATTEQTEYLNTIQHSSESLLAIINDTLDLSRIESGKLLIDEVDFDLLELIENTIELLGPSAYSKRIAILRIIPPEIPLSLLGDPLRIRQILTNLIGNAIKFTQSGSVCIRVQEIERHDKGIVLGIAVSDTGIGIPAAGIAKLFDAYARHESPALAATEGTGLGLSICKKLLDLMGGEIEVLSTPGVGSTFEFRLPFKTRKLPMPFARFPGHVKVALLDSHPLSHQAWRASLTRLGLDVVSIRSISTLKEREASAVIIALGPDDVDRIHETTLGMGSIQLPHIVLAPTAERRILDRISEVCKCRAQNTLIRESALLSEIRLLIPASPAPTVLTRNTPVQHYYNHESDSTNPVILVADDNAINRKLLVTLLQQNKFRVLEAANGQEFLALAAREIWDLALVDIHMPDMDGMEATRQLIAMKAGFEPVVIAISADALPETRAHALAAGMKDYLVKPYSEEQLLEVLKRHLPTSTPN